MIRRLWHWLLIKAGIRKVYPYPFVASVNVKPNTTYTFIIGAEDITWNTDLCANQHNKTNDEK